MNYSIVSTVPLAAKLDSINEQNLNWLPLIELLNVGCTPEELAESLLSIYFVLSDALIDCPQKVATHSLRNDLLLLRQLYVAVHALEEKSKEKISFVIA